MWEFIQKFLGLDRPAKSKQIAKERLRLVLVHDRLELAPGLMEALREDLIKAISKYVEIDASRLEVTIKESKETVALVANIPVLRPTKAAQAR